MEKQTNEKSGRPVWHSMDITRARREAALGQKAATVWLTGLSGSGKSTLANALEKQLAAEGRHTMLLDGDNMRCGLNRNLGFSEPDRKENIRRTAEVCRLMNDAGLIVLTSLISPYRSDRQNARQIVGSSFIEVYVSTSLEECERRDVKGMYAAARKGEIAQFTGITSVYEKPLQPQVIIDTAGRSISESVQELRLKLSAFL